MQDSMKSKANWVASLALVAAVIGASSSVVVVDVSKADVASDDGNYANCKAVRDAGVAPLSRGDAGYSKRLDPDGDGIACE